MERFDKQIFFCLIMIFSGGIVLCCFGIHSYLTSSCCLAVQTCHSYYIHKINKNKIIQNHSIQERTIQNRTIFHLEPPKINITCSGIVNHVLDCTNKINQYVIGCNYAFAKIGYYTVLGIICSFLLSLICILIFDVVEKYRFISIIKRIIKIIKYKYCYGCCGCRGYNGYLVNVDDIDDL